VRWEKMEAIMKMLKAVRIVLVLMAGLAFFVPVMRAEIWDQATRFTFSQPIQLPGLTLPAGTYVFQRYIHPNLVQVYNADRSELITQMFTTPVERWGGAERTTVKIADRMNGPDALLEWFHPESSLGHSFVYEGVEGEALAEEPVTEVAVPTGGMPIVTLN
jgi:hypothetical protein